jgi:hypothetical protein
MFSEVFASGQGRDRTGDTWIFSQPLETARNRQFYGLFAILAG